MRKYTLVASILAFTVVFPLFAGSGFAAPASAADIDKLEKTVDQQQKQIDEQQKSINDLSNQVNALKKEGTAASSQTPAASSGTFVLSGSEQVNVQLYGQVNRGLLYTHDGNESNFYNVDNDNSSTRIGLNGSAGAFGNITLGTKMEVEFQTNDSNRVSQIDKNGVGDNHFRARHFDLFFKSDTFSKMSLGHGSTASDGTSEVDLSGTGVIGYSSVSDMAGGHFFYNSVTRSLSATTVSDGFNNMDGLGRDDRLRYDSPVFMGIQGSTSTSSGGGFDLAGRYNAKFGDFKLATAAAYAWHGDTSAKVDYQLNGSVSVGHTKGFSGTIACGKQNYKAGRNDDGLYFYAKGGFQHKFITAGVTAMALDYGIYNNIDFDGDDARTLSLMAVQNIDKWATEFYCGIRNYSLDRSGASYDNINAVLTGFRLKF